MARRKQPLDLTAVPEEVQAQAKTLIKRAFELLADQVQQISKDLAKFNQKREALRKERQRGVRRTSGRIV